MCDETPQERQNNELAALQSIYGEAVVDNRKNIAWKVWRPLDLMLILTPLHNSDIQGIHCSITLHIQCCENYPDKPPSISIQKLHGISIENGVKLLNKIEELAQEKCGEVMIFELAQCVQQFLHDHNKPILSFYDEMLKDKDEMEKLKLHDKKLKESEERQKIKDEIQKRQEILRTAGRRVHRSSLCQDSENSVLEPQDNAPKLLYYADDHTSPAKKSTKSIPCTCKSKSTQIIRVTQRNNKKIYIGNCLGHSSNGATTYLAIDGETGDYLVAKKWSLPPASDFQTRNRQLTSLQQDLKLTYRLKLKSLVPYIALEMPKEAKKTQSVYIIRDFVLGSSLKFLKTKLVLMNDKFEALRFSRHVGLGIFDALKELHSIGVLHRDVRLENVFLDNKGGVKLVGAALDMRLLEMFDGDSYCDRHSQGQDIYASAQLLLNILSPNRDAHKEIPSDLPISFKDFLSKCLTEDEQSQWSAEQLLNHAFLVDAPPMEPRSNLKDNTGSGSEEDEAVKKIKNTSIPANGHSRLNAEFEVLTWLGKGAFGDVLKVKNKLDGGFYAIKRVQLNPENVQLNKKITREVKLLSRLNHENVVRYYNAWIESIIDNESLTEDDTSVSVQTPVKKQKPVNSLEGIVAKLGQEVKVEWSMSEGPVTQQKDASSESESDDDDEQDPWFNIIRPNIDSSDDSDIEFEVVDDTSETLPSEDVVDSPRPPSERTKQVLYIQMEFCEKHTLRQAIDNGLHQEHFRAWRLFREIVEGLAHVHQRGMIHRDLKPVNIFLDSNDHVKIGDFGLATKAFTCIPVDEKVKLQEDISVSLTGQVGTALYVAPELLQSTTKIIYNQKVDIYSLGIILFEMFHPPLNTGMERMMVLTDLRNKDIKMPDSFVKDENGKQIHVIRWLLNHEASSRPTCAELLASEHVPRPVAEGALSGLLSHTLRHRGSRGYQRLVAACLEQNLGAAEDITYQSQMLEPPSDVLQMVKDNVTKIFRTHGASEFSPPLLTPRTKSWEQYPNAVKVMTASGYVCHLQHDLRLPFARYIAYTGANSMRRYIIDKVFREKHVPGFHPREMIECSFDIVTRKCEFLWYDSELIVVAYRAATECGLKVAIQLNHTDLLKVLLLSCGVPQDKHADIYPVLVDVSLGRITSLQLQTHLTSLCVTNRDVSNLLRLMDTEVTVSGLQELVSSLVKKNQYWQVARKAAAQLLAVCSQAENMGLNCPTTVAPFMAYNATQHTGVFWRLSVVRQNNHKPSKRKAGELIAAGGRYDALVEEFWKVARTQKDHDNAELQTSSVGFSMSLERMAAILKKMDSEVPDVVKYYEKGANEHPGIKKSPPPLDISNTREVSNALKPKPIVLCVPTSGMNREILSSRLSSLAGALWANGRALLCVNTVPANLRAEIVLACNDTKFTLTHAGQHSVREYQLSYSDALDFIKQKLNPEAMKSTDGPANRSISWSETEKTNSPSTSITYITASEKMVKNSKKHIENQIINQVTSILSRIGLQSMMGKIRVFVLALSCEANCVRLLAAGLSAPLHLKDINDAIKDTCERFPKRQSILEETHEELENLAKLSNQNRSSDEIQMCALFSISDSLCRIIT